MSVTGIIHENSYKLEERFFFFSSGTGTGIGNVQGILSSFDVGENFIVSVGVSHFVIVLIEI